MIKFNFINIKINKVIIIIKHTAPIKNRNKITQPTNLLKDRPYSLNTIGLNSNKIEAKQKLCFEYPEYTACTSNCRLDV